MPSTPFTVAHSARTAGTRKVNLLGLSGQIDADTFPKLQRELEGLGNQAQPSVVLDFAALDYISSAGLGVLIKMTREFREKGGDIRFAALPPKIESITDLLGFSQVIRIFPKVDDAVSSFSGPQGPPPGPKKK